MPQFQTKFRSGRYLVPVTIDDPGDGRYYFYFRYDPEILNEIRNLQDRKYHGYDRVNPRKVWSAPKTERNLFALAYLQGQNPYAPYERQLLNVSPRRSLYKHQELLFRVGITRKKCIFAAEMGVGKSLAAIELIEWALINDDIKSSNILWCGTVASLRSIELELEKWNALFVPTLWTYDRLRTADKNQEFDKWLPQIVIFDESSRLKNATAQRTVAATNLAEKMRRTYGDKCYIIEMTGSPSPKSPVDWWSQSEIACPGFLSESNVGALQRRLALIEQEESMQGGVFPKLVTWLDDENKCGHRWKIRLGTDEETGKELVKDRVCGKLKGDPCHELDELAMVDSHPFKPSINEVALLHKRLSGLVEVVLKRDCLDLPEKVHIETILKPSDSIIRTAKLIATNSPRVVTAMTQLRELSDGFLYEDKPTGNKVQCPDCLGTTKIKTLREHDGILSEVPEEVECTNCESGQVDAYSRVATEIETPKEAQLIEDLEDHEDVGRIVIYAAFQASVDRVTKICLQNRWSVIQADGRGWKALTPDGPMSLKPVEMLKSFQIKGKGKLAFVGHPASCGMGLTLTASPTIVWWSLPFSGEDYIQASDRHHRPGMDLNRGATLKYYLHLPTDKLVLENLRNKVGLQALTMGNYIKKEDIARVLK